MFLQSVTVVLGGFSGDTQYASLSSKLCVITFYVFGLYLNEIHNSLINWMGNNDLCHHNMQPANLHKGLSPALSVIWWDALLQSAWRLEQSSCLMSQGYQSIAILQGSEGGLQTAGCCFEASLN